MASFLTVLHLAGTIQFWYGCYYDWTYVRIPVDVSDMGKEFSFTGKFKFLTYIDAVLQATFFTICFLNDIIGSNEKFLRKKPMIRSLKDNILTCLAFPLSMFVGITFWALYAVDRELVFPKAIDPYFPTWLNHVMHTNIMIFILIEMATSFRVYPAKKVGMGVLTSFMLCYLVWIHVIYHYTDMWVYPVLRVLNFPMRLVFFISLLFLALALYVVGEKLNSKIWAKELRQVKTKSN